MVAIDAGHTLAVAGTGSTEGCIPAAARMVTLVANGTAAGDTLT